MSENPLAAFSTATAPQSAPRPANPLAAFSTASASPQAPQAPMTPEPEQERSPLRYAGETLANLPGSAGRAIADLATALFNPIDTATAIGGAATGGMQLLKDKLGGPSPGWFDDHRDKARAVGEFYSDRYGGGQEILDTIREDPFGAALDVGGILTGGAGLAARAPGAAGRVGRAVLDADPTRRVASAAGKAIQERLPTTPSRKEFIADAPSPDQLRGQGSALFEAAEKSGVRFKADYYDKFVDTALSRLVDEGADPILSPKISRIADVLEKTRGTTPSIAQLAITRKQFSNAAGSADRAEARLGSIGVDMVDDFVESGASHVGDTLKEARGLWSRLRKSEIIDGAIENAQVAQAGVEAGLRNEFRSLWKARGSKKMRGFTAAELDAIKSVSEGNLSANILRRVGSLGGGLDASRNMLNLMGGVAGGAAVGGPVGAALVPVAGHIAARASRQAQRTARRWREPSRPEAIRRNSQPCRVKKRRLIVSLRKARPVAISPEAYPSRRLSPLAPSGPRTRGVEGRGNAQ